MNRVILIIITAIVTAIGTYLTTIAYYYFENKIRYIDYKVSATPNILEKIQSQVTMEIKNHPVTSIGLVDFEVLNQTNKDFDELNVNVLLSSKTGKALQNKLISYSFKDLHGRKEQVKLVAIDSTKDLIKLSFKVSPCNRSEFPMLAGTIIVEDIGDIHCEVEAVKQGVDSRPLKANEDEEYFKIPKTLALWIGLPILIILTLIVEGKTNVAMDNARMEQREKLEQAERIIAEDGKRKEAERNSQVEGNNQPKSEWNS